METIIIAIKVITKIQENISMDMNLHIEQEDLQMMNIMINGKEFIGMQNNFVIRLILTTQDLQNWMI